MAIKDFDAERVAEWEEQGLRQCKLGGEVWTIRPFIESHVLRLYDEIEEGTPEEVVWEKLDQAFIGCLVPSQRDRWLEARKRTLESELEGNSEPTKEELFKAAQRVIDVRAAVQMMPWIFELVVGRPLGQSFDSGMDINSTEPSSTGDSSSQESSPEPLTSGVS